MASPTVSYRLDGSTFGRGGSAAKKKENSKSLCNSVFSVVIAFPLEID